MSDMLKTKLSNYLSKTPKPGFIRVDESHYTNPNTLHPK